MSGLRWCSILKPHSTSNLTECAAGRMCWNHSLCCVNFRKAFQAVGHPAYPVGCWDAASLLLTPGLSCWLLGVHRGGEIRRIRSDLKAIKAPTGTAACQKEKRIIDCPPNRNFYQTLGAHNITMKTSNFGVSKQNFSCAMFCFIQHGLI